MVWTKPRISAHVIRRSAFAIMEVRSSMDYGRGLIIFVGSGGCGGLLDFSCGGLNGVWTSPRRMVEGCSLSTAPSSCGDFGVSGLSPRVLKRFIGEILPGERIARLLL